MSQKLLETLKLANREFHEFVDQVEREGTRALGPLSALRRLEDVNLRLKQVSERLSAASGFRLEEPDGAAEVLKYGENLRSLRTVIQTLHVSLLTEKSRMDNTRANLQSACAWANSLHDIS